MTLPSMKTGIIQNRSDGLLSLDPGLSEFQHRDLLGAGHRGSDPGFLFDGNGQGTVFSLRRLWLAKSGFWRCDTLPGLGINPVGDQHLNAPFFSLAVGFLHSLLRGLFSCRAFCGSEGRWGWSEVDGCGGPGGRFGYSFPSDPSRPFIFPVGRLGSSTQMVIPEVFGAGLDGLG